MKRIKSVEQARLYAQSRREDRVTRIYPEDVFSDYLNYLSGISEPLKLRVNILFDDNSTKRPQGELYFSELSKRLYKNNCSISSKEITDNIISLTIEKYFGKEKDELKPFFSSITEPRSFQFSVGCSVIPFDEKNEPISPLLFLNDSRYRGFLPEPEGVTVYPLPKVPYRGRATFENLTYYGGKEKDLIKKLLIQILDNVGVKQTLLSECKDRKIAYEKLTPPGKEIRQHWRIKVDDRWIEPEVHPTLFEEMVNNYDAFAFYPKLKQEVEFEENLLDIQTRLVVECDPRTSSLEYTAHVFDALSQATKRLKLPTQRFHSGSSSPRIHMELNAKNILEKTPYILENFPFIGYSANKPIRNLQDAYNTIINAFKKSLYLFTWNYSELNPRITKDKFSTNYGYVLVDFPTVVSIAAGSPKKLVRLDGKSRRLLKRIDERYRDWNLPVTVNLCTPLLEDEKSPNSHEKILSLCNALFAVGRLNDEFPRLKKKEKVTASNIVSVFEKTPEKQFVDLCTLSEEKFRKRYR